MFTGFAALATALVAEVASIYPLGADAEPIPGSHPLMVLAEPSTLALAVVGAGLMAAGYRVRRAKRSYTQSSQTAYAKKLALHADEQPRRGAA